MCTHTILAKFHSLECTLRVLEVLALLYTDDIPTTDYSSCHSNRKCHRSMKCQTGRQWFVQQSVNGLSNGIHSKSLREVRSKGPWRYVRTEQPHIHTYACMQYLHSKYPFKNRLLYSHTRLFLHVVSSALFTATDDDWQVKTYLVGTRPRPDSAQCSMLITRSPLKRSHPVTVHAYVINNKKDRILEFDQNIPRSSHGFCMIEAPHAETAKSMSE